MGASDLIGSIGVGLLLLAFGLNLSGKLGVDSTTYLLLNIAGAALAAISSYLIRFWPFVGLETVWMVSSVFSLAKNLQNE